MPATLKKVTFIAGAIAILAAVILALFFLLGNQLKGLTNQFKTAKVQRGDIKAAVNLLGKIDSEEHVTLEFQQVPSNGALISWVGVKVGDSVKKNQAIASLDTVPVKKQLEKNLVTFLKTRSQFDQNNFNTNNSSGPWDFNKQSGVNQSQADLNNSVLDVELQKLILDQIVLRSPIDGVLIKADVPTGGVNIATADEAKYEIVNPAKIFFNVDIDENEVINYHTGDKGTIILNAFPTEELPTTVSSISYAPHTDSDGNVFYTLSAQIDSTNSDKYRFGMTGSIVFKTLAEKVLYVPKDIVHTDDTGSFVRVGDTKKVVYIQTGVNDDQNIEVIKGVDEGSEIHY